MVQLCTHICTVVVRVKQIHSNSVAWEAWPTKSVSKHNHITKYSNAWYNYNEIKNEQNYKVCTSK